MSLFNILECGQYLGLVRMNRHSMLEMGGRLTVFGATLPAVVADDDILASEIYHGLYGDDHAGLQK